MHRLYLALAIASEVGATLSLRASASFTRPLPSLAVIAGYAAAFYFLSLAVEKIHLGVAYAIWSGVGIALLALYGVFIARQRLDLAAVAGISLILAGVLVLTLASETAVH